MNERTDILPTPIKSDSDRKEYRMVRLSNGLKALLVDSTHAVPVTAAPDEDEDDDSESETSVNSDDEAEEEHEEQDDETMAACSLMVDVGSFSDPRQIQVRFNLP